MNIKRYIGEGISAIPPCPRTSPLLCHALSRFQSPMGTALSVPVANLFGAPIPCGFFLLSIFWTARKPPRNGISACNGPMKGGRAAACNWPVSLQFLKNKALSSCQYITYQHNKAIVNVE